MLAHGSIMAIEGLAGEPLLPSGTEPVGMPEAAQLKSGKIYRDPSGELDLDPPDGPAGLDPASKGYSSAEPPSLSLPDGSR